MSIVINPGTQDTDDFGWECAYDNMKQFIKDCEIELYIVKSNFEPEDNGRYWFKLESKEIDGYSVEVEMPALPLEQVRYIKEKDQNVWDFPRLYVDGSSWLWCFAIVKKKSVLEGLRDELGVMEEDIINLKELIKNLEMS